MRASTLASGPMPSGNSTVATTKKASTTATSPGRRHTSRRSRAIRAVKPLTSRRSKVRAPEIFSGAWVAAIARPPSPRWLSRITRRASCESASSAFRGSSSSQSGAADATTRASATRRRWPADRVRTARAASGVSPNAARASSMRAASVASPRRRWATKRFSRTERSPLRPSWWPSHPSEMRQASRSTATSAPCQEIVPASAGTSRASARSRVVLPLPLGPVSTSNSPVANEKDRPSKTRRPPRWQASPATSSSLVMRRVVPRSAAAAALAKEKARAL